MFGTYVNSSKKLFSVKSEITYQYTVSALYFDLYLYKRQTLDYGNSNLDKFHMIINSDFKYFPLIFVLSKTEILTKKKVAYS